MKKVGLPEEYARKTCLEISGGEAQRAAIARALMIEPELFISHDIGLVSNVCERLMVMCKGQMLECGETFGILENPQHGYTKKLIDSIL